MGLEITRKTPLNQYEAVNHKSAIKLWLHDVVDDIIVPGLISLETLFVTITEIVSASMAELYAPLEHEHPEYEGGGAEFPVGMLTMFGGSTAPSKWLLCNGAAVSRTTYADLFTAISTTYGVGDGTTTFNLPDFCGRAPIGAGQGSGLTARALGDMLGEEAHANTLAENGPHSHSGPSHTHTMAHTHIGGAHTHGIPGEGIQSPGATCVGTILQPATIVLNTSSGGAVSTSGASTSTTSSSGTGATGSSGTGTPHNNMQPSLVVNFIIYSGVTA